MVPQVVKSYPIARVEAIIAVFLRETYSSIEYGYIIPQAEVEVAVCGWIPNVVKRWSWTGVASESGGQILQGQITEDSRRE